ncbi:MAG: pyruvate formate lyase family protein [Candidatus Omnitrophota bacterium]|nr:pyruvate formate lyase family protein [Candidatus Omnitrophota bacterium]
MPITNTVIQTIKKDNEMYLDWLNKIGIDVGPDSYLAGPFVSPPYPVWPRNHDNFHYPLGMRRLLSLGFAGIKKEALDNAQKFNGNEKEYLLLIAQVYSAVIEIVKKFSLAAQKLGLKEIHKTCVALTERAPQTFLEACQLYWFAVIFRIGTSTVGRTDQHLFHFYKNDVGRNILTCHEAKKIVDELLFRFEKRGSGVGDTLQNIMLSGQDADGNDQTNDISYIILESMIINKYIEPKINVRLHKNSTPRLLELVARLQLTGRGICTVFNDDFIIKGLKLCGRPEKIAYNYCNDGCSEIILDGCGETWFRYIDCVKAVEHVLFNGAENIPDKKKMQYYSSMQDSIDVGSPIRKGLSTGDFLKMESFDEFYEAYLKQIKYQIRVMLKDPYNSDAYPMRLFTAATMPDVLENATEPYRNPSCYHTYGLFIGSLGTAVNSLAAVKYLIYDKKNICREDLLSALRNNFQDYRVLQGLCKGAPKFGNDDDFVDKLAVDIAGKFALWVQEHKDRTGRPILPGLYNHLFNHTAYSVGATPDGREFGSLVGEHISPTPGTALKGPTAVINSVCKLNLSEQVFGSTLHLNLPLTVFKEIEHPESILISLVKVFCQKGGCVLNINILDKQKLLDAQKHPDRYKDLIVRVWGFSYYFVLLSKEMQDHVIARAQ